jgi:hypothetical protein
MAEAGHSFRLPPSSFLFSFSPDRIASASISIGIYGETKAVIDILAFAGRMSGRNFPLAFSTFPNPRYWLETPEPHGSNRRPVPHGVPLEMSIRSAVSL